MSNFIVNSIFAGASIALTAGIVAAAAAPAADAAIPIAPQAKVRYSDLNLGDKGGRADLDARIRLTAKRVCPAESNADFGAIQCRGEAIAKAHRDIAEQVASRPSASVQKAAL